jgi:3-oxoacyl-[acyl-carrier protein] reductase
MFELTGKVALVTGAGRRAGKAIAEAFARQGAAVAVNDVVRALAEEAAEAIRAAGGKAVAAPFDVTDLAAVRAGMEAAAASLGPIDILVNNAGNGGAQGMSHSRFIDMDPAEWRGPVEINLFGVMNCSHAALRPMTERGWGRIITISSYAGTHGNTGGLSHYAAGKGGGLSFMRHLAMENAAAGVTANTIALGLIREGDDPRFEKLTRQIPVQRRGMPEDVAALCVYLASEEAGWLTGQTIQLNGGVHTT